MANTENKHSHHHILTDKTVLCVGSALAVLTIITVAVAQIDLGSLNFPVAMLVATIKASLVALFFMNLLYDNRENGVIFVTSFLFLAIFIVLTSVDLFFRGDVYVRPGALIAQSSTKSKLKNPWIATPELIAHGKELFAQQCATCHGPQGFGDGPAGAALNPHPRNFHQTADWVNGRLPSQVFKTLKEGIPGSSMASFATLPVDDRWALDAFVLSLGPEHPQETGDTLAKIGYDLKTGTQSGGAEKEEQTIPIDFAMDLMAKPEPKLMAVAAPAHPDSAGGQIFEARCASCHGAAGEGGIRVKALGGFVKAHLVTSPLTAELDSVKSADAFNRVVLDGLPGQIMPGDGQLSGAELSELHSYVRTLATKNR